MTEKKLKFPFLIMSIMFITIILSFLNLLLNIQVASFDHQSYMGDDGINYETSNLQGYSQQEQHEQKTLQFLHIPKAGGSAVTQSATDANIVSEKGMIELHTYSLPF